MGNHVSLESTLQAYRLRCTVEMSDACFLGIIDSYREPYRHYHTLDHLLDLFQSLERIRGARPIPESLAYAVWYHDVVCDPKRPDNEEQSASRAVIELSRCSVDSRTIESVRRMILLTKHGSGDPESDEEMCLLDADLAIFGSDANRYDGYSTAIRKEYAHVADLDYRKGRSAVLIHFLNRPRIYQTAVAFQNWESTARQNLGRELIAMTL